MSDKFNDQPLTDGQRGILDKMAPVNPQANGSVSLFCADTPEGAKTNGSVSQKTVEVVAHRPGSRIEALERELAEAREEIERQRRMKYEWAEKARAPGVEYAEAITQHARAVVDEWDSTVGMPAFAPALSDTIARLYDFIHDNRLAKNPAPGSLTETPLPSTAQPLAAGHKPEKQFDAGRSADEPASQLGAGPHDVPSQGTAQTITPADLMRAATNCGHEINYEAVTLLYDPNRPGHNALNQLTRRLCEAVGIPYEVKNPIRAHDATACRNCGATEQPDACSGGPWCKFPRHVPVQDLCPFCKKPGCPPDCMGHYP